MTAIKLDLTSEEARRYAQLSYEIQEKKNLILAIKAGIKNKEAEKRHVFDGVIIEAANAAGIHIGDVRCVKIGKTPVDHRVTGFEARVIDLTPTDGNELDFIPVLIYARCRRILADGSESATDVFYHLDRLEPSK